MQTLALFTIALAFAFTFTNGFQDAGSIAATFIASRSATPRQGVSLIAVMAFLGSILGGSAVAFTFFGLLTIDSGPETIIVLFAAVLSATLWNLLTWHKSLPSSSTHALVGGLLGAGIAAAGMGSVYWGVAELLSPAHELTGVVKIIAFLLLSVLIGFVGSFALHRVAGVLLRNAKRSANRSIIRLNWVAAALMSFANGANDSQKQMGIIALVLFAAGETLGPSIPLWARFGCAILLALGTLGGGWRIMKTLGHRIFRLEPIHSFNSQLASGLSIALANLAGAPISSTHVISMSVLGVGAAEDHKRVHWSVGKDILLAMITTIPATMIFAAGVYLLIATLTGG